MLFVVNWNRHKSPFVLCTPIHHFLDETEKTRPRIPRMLMQEQSSSTSLCLKHPEEKLEVCDALLHEVLATDLAHFACLRQLNQSTEATRHWRTEDIS